jgi:alkanesulfonate monooxygenase SsuD/methylene tetrahydromethanopterin reductase-like flavin-dependent oxidoreductase (luciferase family)
MDLGPVRGHRDIVAAALDDWWITTDPQAPFHPHELADRIESYLRGSGYAIGPDLPTPQPPTRRETAEIAVLAGICALAAALAAALGDWWWCAAGTLGAAALTNTARRDITTRRRHHQERP